MNTKLESFKNKLLEKGLKPTLIRLKILEYIINNKMHPTAEVIYKDLIKEIPTISKTTVYNTLNVFAQSGLVTPIYIADNEARFDGDILSHQHLLCDECREIFDLHKNCVCIGKEYIEEHKISEIHCYFKGICKSCLKKGKY